MEKTDILKIIEEKDIKFIEIWFSDILGFLKSFTIPKEELSKAFDEGIGGLQGHMAGYGIDSQTNGIRFFTCMDNSGNAVSTADFAGDYSKTPDFPTFADGHYEMQLCEAIERSAKEKVWIKV